MKEYPETHQKGHISFDHQIHPKMKLMKATFGVQIAKDGRVWICINGKSFIRFKPEIEKGGD